MKKWYESAGPYGDTVLASFIRLARNVDGMPYPVRLNVNQKNELNARVCAALDGSGKKYSAVRPDSLYPYEAVALAEQCVITPEFAAAADGALLLVPEEGGVSLMLNDEDHVRIIASCAGLSPEQAYASAAAYDDLLDSRLRFAFDAKLGYLNQAPLNIGTGMKASVLMHLPALSKSGSLAYFASTASKLGLAVKGAFGDGITVKGDIFRISNTLTMGLSEDQAMGNLKSLCLQLATRERTAAEELIQDISVKDKIQRACAVLSGAALLTSDETSEMLSYMRLGAVYGLIEADIEAINSLFVTTQPANVNLSAGVKLSRGDRDELRARIVKEKLFA